MHRRAELLPVPAELASVELQQHLLHLCEPRGRVLAHEVTRDIVPERLGHLARDAAVLDRVEPRVNTESPLLRAGLLAIEDGRVGPGFVDWLEVERAEELQYTTHRVERGREL